MRNPAFLVVACLATFTASAEGTPSFRPVDVRKQCAVLKKSTTMLEEVVGNLSLMKMELHRMNLSVTLRDYSGARARKREIVGSLRAMGEALDRAVEAQIYLTQLGEYVQTLTPTQVRKLLPHMAECIAAVEALKAPSPLKAAAAPEPEEDSESMEDGGFVD